MREGGQGDEPAASESPVHDSELQELMATHVQQAPQMPCCPLCQSLWSLHLPLPAPAITAADDGGSVRVIVEAVSASAASDCDSGELCRQSAKNAWINWSSCNMKCLSSRNG